eukprot:4594399-Prymnesium_polylepis.1
MTSKRHRVTSSSAGGPPEGSVTGTWRKRPAIILVRAAAAGCARERRAWGRACGRMGVRAWVRAGARAC